MANALGLSTTLTTALFVPHAALFPEPEAGLSVGERISFYERAQLRLKQTTEEATRQGILLRPTSLLSAPLAEQNLPATIQRVAEMRESGEVITLRQSLAPRLQIQTTRPSTTFGALSTAGTSALAVTARPVTPSPVMTRRQRMITWEDIQEADEPEEALAELERENPEAYRRLMAEEYREEEEAEEMAEQRAEEESWAEEEE